MKPISLHGHERSITQIRYNREGDLIFSSAKDPFPNVWYSINGERLGTFGKPGHKDSHSGAVWCVDVDWESKHFLSGAADNSTKLWDVSTGKLISHIATKTSVRSCTFSYSGNLVFYCTDKIMGHPCSITVVDVREFSKDKPVMELTIPDKGPKITCSVWDSQDEKFVTGHDNGDIVLWDLKAQNKVTMSSDHSKHISDLQVNNDRTMLISASKDYTAKLFDFDTLTPKKTYVTERPVNSASISPKYDHVVVGGGQEAMDVTTTSSRVGKFDARFFHTVFEDEFGRVKGHFGPINSLQFHPDGNGYASGGEDGYVRLHVFDQSYHDYYVEY